MVQKTTKLGGTASDVTVGRVAWADRRIQHGFRRYRGRHDALPAGTKAFLNSGEFYAKDLGTANLEMLSRFFAKYPEYADKTFLSVKVRPESIRNSVDNIQRVLGPIKIDLFEPARIDRKVPVEEMMQTLVTPLKEGKFSHIGLSECNTTRSVYPVTANQKKVIATAAELGISVLAYSPPGRGLLAGKIKSHADMAGPDIIDVPENMKHNVTIVEALDAMAQSKGTTVAQICIAWVAALGPSKSTPTLENLQAGDVELSVDELKEMNGIIAKYGVKGDRSIGLSDEQMHLWG
ncbi:aldo/keto reductase [Mycena crocata]|nr:aldo/keto reductase [Mycena crocata]